MEKGRTIIVGAGGFGRELINWASDCHRASLLPPVVGMIDDDPGVMDGFAYDIGLIGAVMDFAPEPDDHLLMAIGTPAIKEHVAEMLKVRGGRFVSMIHPTVVIAKSARISEGSILCPMALVSADAEVGHLVTINALSSIGHDVSCRQLLDS